MNLLHIDEQRGWRGGEQQASWLIQGLVARGHRIVLAGRAGEPFLTAEHGGCEAGRAALPFLGEWDLYTAWQLSKIVRRESVDILHAHTSHAHTMALLARFFARRGQVVVSRRVGFSPKNNPVNRWKYSRPDRIVCVSEKVGEVLRAYGVNERLLAVVHSSVDLQRLDVAPLPRSELGVPEGVPLLFTAGALVGHKDHENLVRAMGIVVKTLPGAQLLLAGEGELRGRIEERIAALGLRETITMLGHRTDVPRIVRAADRYISSSWSEGLGTSILEALACETPVVATEAGGAAEMVRPGETGHLVPARDHEVLAEAILTSLGHREEAQAMAAAGRKLIEQNFTPEHMVEGTLKVYEDLLDCRANSG